MTILFNLLDKCISQENFGGLLDVQKFGILFNAEDIHTLLMRYSAQYANPDYHQKQGETLPQYILLYPDMPLWDKMVSLLQQEKHQEKMRLVNVWMNIRIEKIKKDKKVNQAHIDHFLAVAELSSDELYGVMRRFGPDMLDVQELSSIVPKYYKTLVYRDPPLLYTLLDKRPSDGIANQLLASTLLDDAEVRKFFRRYGNSYLPFCYRSSAARALRKKLDWREVQPYVPAWLNYGMDEQELEDVLGGVSLDSSLLEAHGQRYLIDYPTSKVFLKLTRRYLQAFDISVLQHERGKHFLRFLYQYEQKELPSDFTDLIELINDWYETLCFIEKPSIQQNMLLTVFSIIFQKVPPDEQPSWIELLAKALVTCINYPSDLGFVLSSISMTNTDFAVLCLFDMTDDIKRQISSSSHDIC